MPRPESFQDLLQGPVYIINMDRSVERWHTTVERVVAAGFQRKNIRRISAIDAGDLKTNALANAWESLGPSATQIDRRKDPEFFQYPGKQGCFLSHVKSWKTILEEGSLWGTVFEDDVLFHPEWATLGPSYFAATPAKWDLLYMGCQMDFKSPYHVDIGPAYCTHAMVLTQEGTKRLYDYVCHETTRLYTIDNLFHDLQAERTFPLPYYIWNAQSFPCALANMPRGWDRRNHGLVFQDEAMGSYIKDHY